MTHFGRRDLWRGVTERFLRVELGALRRSDVSPKRLCAAVGAIACALGVAAHFGRWGRGAAVVAVPTFSSLGLCFLAILLGFVTVRRDLARGTADALLLTPVPRLRLLRAKLLATLEPLVVPGLLMFPVYLCCQGTFRDPRWFAATSLAHGGFLRLGAIGCLPEPFILEYLAMDGPLPGSVTDDAVFALMALVSDFAWFTVFAAIGVRFGATRDANVLGGLGLGAVVLVAAALIEGVLSTLILIESRPFPEGTWMCVSYCLPLFRFNFFPGPLLGPRDTLVSMPLSLLLWGMANVARVMLARRFLGAAAKRYEEMALG